MQVPHNAFVLVVDGRKSLFFRNEGDAEHPNLKVEHAEEHVNPRDGEQKTDAAGSARSTQSGAGAPPIAQGGSNRAGGGGQGEGAGDEWRRGGRESIWNSANARESVNVLLAKQPVHR